MNRTRYKQQPKGLRLTLLAAAIASLAAPTAHAASYTWSTGDFSAAIAPSPLLSGDTLTIDSGGTKRFNGSASNFSNYGTVVWLNDNLQGGNFVFVGNAGLWDALSDTTSLSHNFGGQSTFTNTGTFRKSGGSGNTTIGNWAFINYGGTLEAQSGTLLFNGSSTSFNAGSRFTGAGVVNIAGNASFNGSFYSDNLLLSSGNFTGNAASFDGGVASSAGAVTWQGGDLYGSWTIGSDATLTAINGGSKRQVGSSIVNNGTVLWNSTEAFQSGNHSHFANSGLFDAQQSMTISYNYGGHPIFSNAASGIVRASGGATLTVGGVNLISNGGEFNATSGSTINYAGNFATFNSGTRFTGDGTHTVSSNARFVGDFIAGDNLRFTGGAQRGGDGSVGSSATLHGLLTWVSSDLEQNWEIAAGSTLTAINGGSKRQVGGSIVNNGTVLWNSTEAFQSGNHSHFANSGLFDAQQSMTISHNYGGHPIFSNAASGIVRASGGATLTVGGVNLISNGGEFNATSGSTINYAGNSATFNSGTRFTGDGSHIFSSNARFIGDFIAGDNLRFTGGTQFGGDGVSAGSKGIVADRLTWVSSDLQGNWEIAAGSTLTAINGGSKRQVGGSVVNNGTVLWNSADAFQNGNSSSFTNNGLFDAQQSMTISYNYGGHPIFSNAASGIVRASGGETLTVGGVNLISNGGEFNATSGSTIHYAGNSATFNSGTRFTGAGSHIVSNNVRFVGDFTAGSNLRFTGGTQFGGDGVSAGSKGIVADRLTWVSSDLQGNWEIAAGSTLTAIDGGSKHQVGGSVVNNGTVLWNSTEAFRGGNSGSFTNNGRFEVASDADVTYNFGGQNSFANHGRFVKSAGGGETSVAGVAFSNNPGGVVEVQSGSIRLPNGFTNQGTLMGIGQFVTNTLTNAGHVAPGASPGTLTIAGNFVQTAAGVFDVEIGTLLSSDRLNVTGAATIAGTLALSCFGACSLAQGDTLLILDAVGQLSGTFSNVTLTGFSPTSAFHVVYDYDLDEVRLVALSGIAPVPEPQAWTLMLAGLGLLGGLRRVQRAG